MSNLYIKILRAMIRALISGILLIGTVIFQPVGELPGVIQAAFDDSGQISARQAARLVADDAGEGDTFGLEVAISGDTAVVGAPEDDEYGEGSGSAYVFQREGDSWVQSAKLYASDAGHSNYFGRSVTIDGDTIVVGAYVNVPGGAVYVFERDYGGQGKWGEVIKLKGHDTYYGDAFGISVDLDGDRLAVGQYAGGDYVGSVYVFERNHGGYNAWGEVAKLTASDGAAYDYFGYATAVSGDIVVAGAPGRDGLTGAVYVYERNHGGQDQWGEVTRLEGIDQDNYDYFGISLALDGDMLAAGAPMKDEQEGVVYLFQNNGGWSEVDQIKAAEPKSGDNFGGAVAIYEDFVAVGAEQRGTGGEVHLFVNQDGDWQRAAELSVDDLSEGDAFGSWVDLDASYLAVGVPGDDDEGQEAGSAYLFSLAHTPASELKLFMSPGFIDEGSLTELKGSFFDPDQGEYYWISVNWGDGVTETLDISPYSLVFTTTHRYMDDPAGEVDIFPVSVKIEDAYGAMLEGMQSITVTNIAPTILAIPGGTVNFGEVFTTTGSFVDPGMDTWTAVVDYGDGSGIKPLGLEEKGFKLVHTYQRPGKNNLRVFIADDDGGIGEAGIIVNVLWSGYIIYMPVLSR